LLSKKDYLPLIKTALKEDFSDVGDITSQAIFRKDEESIFVLLSKNSGILCGAEIFKEVFKQIDAKCGIEFYFKDGDGIKSGDIVARVSGRTISILKGERTSLNLICHLSGIATKTHEYLALLENKIRILDTRKTIPGLRKLQKYAVACGGGTNHRMGLYDMVLIKDNHIDACGSIKKAVERIRSKYHDKFLIEVETRNLREVEEAKSLKVDRIMFDNMDHETMKKACEIINHEIETEASGNFDTKKAGLFSDIGVDFISIGELTHSVKVFDFSLKKEK
jgi:nicotinate-nucleotide pyrophosphorylase (carboxylating)